MALSAVKLNSRGHQTTLTRFPMALGLVIRGGTAGEAALGAIHLWGAASLIFLCGVRRGLSFRTPGGWRWSQMGVFAGLFWAGLLALMLPVGWALWLLAAAYLSLAVLDPAAARREEAPLYFRTAAPVADGGAGGVSGGVGGGGVTAGRGRWSTGNTHISRRQLRGIPCLPARKFLSVLLGLARCG